MNEREYERLKREIREKCEQDLAALERVWQLAQASAKAYEEARSGGRKGEVIELVRAAVDSLPVATPFTQRDVIGEFRKLNPDAPELNRASVVSALRRLAHVDGVISVVEAGKGKRASTYTRPVQH